MMDYSVNTHKEIVHAPIDVKSAIHEIINIQLRDSPSIESSINITGSASFISDPARFDIIFHHLINNAVRFSDRRKERFIRIECAINEKCAEISVSDNGLGIPDDVGDKIFDMFYRASAISIGSGLGLFIVKEALQKVGGEISYTSRVGAGTNFVVMLANLESSLL